MARDPFGVAGVPKRGVLPAGPRGVMLERGVAPLVDALWARGVAPLPGAFGARGVPLEERGVPLLDFGRGVALVERGVGLVLERGVGLLGVLVCF